jgi:hypothetical protein
LSTSHIVTGHAEDYCSYPKMRWNGNITDRELAVICRVKRGEDKELLEVDSIKEDNALL